ncbi:hypothetical protein ACFJGV_12865 [Cnuibacter sp. UC19_7]|uniref:hypothetical protein n=1 Tax=Cnuibacter sp. UC19_7 TaxID=3350166 RepID=UPI0036705B2A
MTLHRPSLHVPDPEQLPAPVTGPLLAGGLLASGAVLMVRFGAWLVAEQLRTHRTAR